MPSHESLVVISDHRWSFVVISGHESLLVITAVAKRAQPRISEIRSEYVGLEAPHARKPMADNDDLVGFRWGGGCVWCGVVVCGGAVWRGAAWCAAWCDAVWWCVVWCGAVRCGVARCGAVRCGAVRCGVRGVRGVAWCSGSCLRRGFE